MVSRHPPAAGGGGMNVTRTSDELGLPPIVIDDPPLNEVIRLAAAHVGMAPEEFTRRVLLRTLRNFNPADPHAFSLDHVADACVPF